MTTYYVATTGVNTNAGTSSGAPFRTIQKALDAVASGGGDTINIASGTYNEQCYLTKACTIIGQADKSVIMDSSMVITGWTSVGTELYRATFTDAAQAPSAGGLTYPGVFANKSGLSQYNDRLAFVHLNAGTTQASWLRQRDNAYALGRGEFYTNVTSDNGSPGTTHQVTVRLADGTSPASQTVRMAQYPSCIYIDSNITGAISISGMTFQRAGATVIDCSSSNVTIDNCLFQFNRGFNIATYFNGAAITVKNSICRYFEYEFVHVQSNNSLVDTCTVGPTIAPWSNYGAVGVNISGADNVTVRDTVFDGIQLSSGGTSGVGVQLEDWNPGDGLQHGNNNLIERCIMRNNGGHGITGSGSNHIIRNNAIYYNGGSGIGEAQTGGGGGAAIQQSLGWKIYNNTIVRNGWNNVALGFNPNGLQFDNTPTVEVKNNIIYDNFWGDKYYANSGGITESNNIFSPTNPLFTTYNNANASSTWNFHLASGSPAIGTGIVLSGVTVDLEKTARTTTRDIGAYAYTVGATAGGGVITSVPSYAAGTTVTVTAYPDAGFYLNRWMINGVSSGNTNPRSITMNANQTVIAVFRANGT
jgi:hypothetical protein